MGYLKSGDSVLIWGQLNKDAQFRQFESGTMVASFSVRFGFEDKLYGDTGKRKGKWMDVKAWGRDYDHNLCDYCACLEQGDSVLVAGTLTLDKKPDRDGNDRWYLNAEYVNVQPTVEAAEQVFTEEDGPGDDLPEEFRQDEFPEVLQ